MNARRGAMNADAVGGFRPARKLDSHAVPGDVMDIIYTCMLP
jgi:hypothetical protein